MEPYIKLLRKWQQTTPLWLSIWDCIMYDDYLNLSYVLDNTGWSICSPDKWTLYDIIVRFKKWGSMRVYMTKVPLQYLKYRYQLNFALPDWETTHVRPIIREEANKRSWVFITLARLPIPLDCVRTVVSYLNPQELRNGVLDQAQ